MADGAVCLLRGAGDLSHTDEVFRSCGGLPSLLALPRALGRGGTRNLHGSPAACVAYGATSSAPQPFLVVISERRLQDNCLQLMMCVNLGR